jgi:Protein of unknown function (DUF2997)
VGVEEIEVVISPTGEVSIEVRGVTGMSCRNLTADLEKALGGEIVDRQMKPEAYAQQTDEQQTWNRTSW